MDGDDGIKRGRGGARRGASSDEPIESSKARVVKGPQFSHALGELFMKPSFCGQSWKPKHCYGMQCSPQPLNAPSPLHTHTHLSSFSLFHPAPPRLLFLLLFKKDVLGSSLLLYFDTTLTGCKKKKNSFKTGVGGEGGGGEGRGLVTCDGNGVERRVG